MRKREKDLKLEDDTLWALKMKEEATSQRMQRNAEPMGRSRNVASEKKKMSNAKSEESFLYLSLTTTHSSENLNNPN